MSQNPMSPMAQTTTLAELLDARPDTREMISANLDLAHACLELKRGETAQAEQIVSMAKDTSSPEYASISVCIKAEILRLTGRASEAWDLAEELVAKNRFDTVAALYLRFLFPFHIHATPPHRSPEPEVAPDVPIPVTSQAPEPPVEHAPAPLESSWTDAPPERIAHAVVSEPTLHALQDLPSQSFHEPDSEVSIAVEHDPSEDEVPVAMGELPPALARLCQDESVRLLRLRTPDGGISESLRSSNPIHDLDAEILDRPSSILETLRFGRLLHAGFEGPEGAAHVWSRSGRTLYLVVGQTASAPALAARCSRAMEDLA